MFITARGVGVEILDLKLSEKLCTLASASHAANFFPHIFLNLNNIRLLEFVPTNW